MRITYRTAHQENLNLNEKRQLTDVNTNITDVGVLWKGFKTNVKKKRKKASAKKLMIQRKTKCKF